MDPDPLSCSLSTICAIPALSDCITFNTPSIGSIIAIIFSLLFLCISAFVSASEIAYFSLTQADIDDMDENKEPDRTVIKLLNKPEHLLATILIGNNLVNVTVVILCTYAFNQIITFNSSALSFIFQTIILTFILLLVGEILPKLYANSNNVKWALRATSGLNFLNHIFAPLSHFMVRSTRYVNRMVGDKNPQVSTDDISQALEITDVAEEKDKEMLEGILKFGDTTASEVMTPRIDIVDVSVDMPYDELLKFVIEKGYSRMPVYEDTEDNIKGILYSRDLLPHLQESADFNWNRLLRPTFCVPETRMIDDLLEDFRRRKIHMAIVVDEFGGTEGIVTLEDILEEIVGEIDDEYDDTTKQYKKISDDSYIFEGKILLNDFFRAIDCDEDVSDEYEDAETLAGLILAIKEDFPVERERIEYGRYVFTIMEIDRHRISKVRVKVRPTTDNEPNT